MEEHLLYSLYYPCKTSITDMLKEKTEIPLLDNR